MADSGIEESDLAVLAPRSKSAKAAETEIKTKAEKDYSINHFNYKRRRPFHPDRLLNLLKNFPPDIIRYGPFDRCECQWLEILI